MYFNMCQVKEEKVKSGQKFTFLKKNYELAGKLIQKCQGIVTPANLPLEQAIQLKI